MAAIQNRRAPVRYHAKHEGVSPASFGIKRNHLLYAYRVYLTGIHAMENGEIEANIRSLNERFRLEQIDELVARKTEGTEKMLLAAGEVEQHERFFDELESRLNEAHEKSRLPEEATTARDLDDFVVRIRLERAQR